MAVPTLTANSPSAGFIAWGAFTIQYGGVAYSVPASNTNATYVGWLYNGGSPLLVTNNNAPTMSAVANGTSAQWAGTTPVLGSDDLLLFVNRSGTPINVQAAQLIDGDMILTGTLTSANIATGSIVSNSLYTGGVQANLIQAANIAADTITANQIAANAIGTSELSASAVVADKIAAGAITAEKLTIGSLGDNMVKNSGMEDASQANAALPANWTSGFEQTGTPAFLWQAGIVGNKSIGITNSTVNGGAWGSDPFPVVAGQTLAFSALAKASATSGSQVYMRIFYGTNQAMTRITTTPNAPTNVQWMDTGTGIVSNATGGGFTACAEVVGAWALPTTNPIMVTGASLVPATATWAQIALYNWSGPATTTVYFDEVSMNEVILSARIANGSIQANNIMANTITASQIASGTINTTQLNANAINGMTITSNTINSATINSANITASSTITGATIQTAVSPTKRVVMSSALSDRIQFFNGTETTPAAIQVSNSVGVGGTVNGALSLLTIDNGSGQVALTLVPTGQTASPGCYSNYPIYPGSGGTATDVRFRGTGSGSTFGMQFLDTATGWDTRFGSVQGSWWHAGMAANGAVQWGFDGTKFRCDTFGPMDITTNNLTLNATQTIFSTATHGCSIISQGGMPGYGSAGQDNFLSCRAATNTLGSTNYANSVWGGFLAKTGGYGTVSTYHSKVDVEPLTGALDLVSQAPAYKFKSLHGDFVGMVDPHPEHPDFILHSNSEDWHFGPLYEDLHDHVRDSDQPTVNLGDLIGVLWGAVQELSEQVKALQEK